MKAKKKSTRAFYKHTVTIEILSEDPVIPSSLADIAYICTEGDCSAKWDSKCKNIGPARAAEELLKQGSDPEFFGLDSEGNDI